VGFGKFVDIFAGGTFVRKALLGTGLSAILMVAGVFVASAQDPLGPRPRGFDGRGSGPGGPMVGMFEFGGLMGGFGGKVVTGKPILATFTITRTETLPGNTISNTTTGTFARDTDGSTYRDAKFTAIGPWAASGKAEEFIYIRNITKGTQYIVHVTKATYEAFPIHERGPRDKDGKRANRPSSSDEVVTDNPNGMCTDPATKTVYSNVDDRKVTRTIPAGTIGNEFAIVITSERWYSAALDLLLEETHTDPRFGTTTYQLSNIGQSPAASLFVPDPSFTQVQGRKFGLGGHREEPKQPPASQD
jgi:hypothetical protein